MQRLGRIFIRRRHQVKHIIIRYFFLNGLGLMLILIHKGEKQMFRAHGRIVQLFCNGAGSFQHMLCPLRKLSK